MRDMLLLFMGTPSTSPFCRWVNETREPEELPPDWKPDDSLPPPLADDPPFLKITRRKWPICSGYAAEGITHG
jgi:hypothetical protein